jgi:hypothetical protein
MSPEDFANDVARSVRSAFRTQEGATETGQHGAGLRAAAQQLWQQVKVLSEVRQKNGPTN